MANAAKEVEAYYFEQPDQKVGLDTLLRLGVEVLTFDADKYETDPAFDAMCKERGYDYRDIVDSSKIPNFQEKLNTFKTEHLHEDDEIRFFLNGSGYFDVRDEFDAEKRLIRIKGVKNLMITLPAGMYHRFMPDESMYFYVLRLFQGAPIWTPYNREEAATDLKPQRAAYLAKYNINQEVSPAAGQQ